jgi:hypothetical protein
MDAPDPVEVAKALDRAKRPTLNAYTTAVPRVRRNVRHHVAMTLSVRDDFHKGATEFGHHPLPSPSSTAAELARMTYMPVLQQIFFRCCERAVALARRASARGTVVVGEDGAPLEPCEFYMEMVPAAPAAVAERRFRRYVERHPTATAAELATAKSDAIERAEMRERFTDVTFHLLSFVDVDPSHVLRRMIAEHYYKAYGTFPDDDDEDDEDAGGNGGAAAAAPVDEAIDDGMNVVEEGGGGGGGGLDAIIAAAVREQRSKKKRKKSAAGGGAPGREKRTAGERFDQTAREVHDFDDLYKQVTSKELWYDIACMYTQRQLGHRESAHTMPLSHRDNPARFALVFSPYLAAARRSPLAVHDMRVGGTLFTAANPYAHAPRGAPAGTYEVHWPRTEMVLRVPLNKVTARYMMTQVFPWTVTTAAHPLTYDLPSIARIVAVGGDATIDTSCIHEDARTGALTYVPTTTAADGGGGNEVAVRIPEEDALMDAIFGAEQRDDDDDDADGGADPDGARARLADVVDTVLDTPGMPRAAPDVRELIRPRRSTFDPAVLMTHQGALSSRLVAHGTSALSMTAVHDMLNAFRELQAPSERVLHAIEAEHAAAVRDHKSYAERTCATARAAYDRLRTEYADAADAEDADVSAPPPPLMRQYATWLVQYAPHAAAAAHDDASMSDDDGTVHVPSAQELLETSPRFRTLTTAAETCTAAVHDDVAGAAQLRRLEAWRRFAMDALAAVDDAAVVEAARLAGVDSVTGTVEHVRSALYEACADANGARSLADAALRCVVLAVDVQRTQREMAATKEARERYLVHQQHVARQYNARCRHPHSTISMVGRRVHEYRLSTAVDPYNRIAPAVVHYTSDLQYSTFANLMFRRFQEAESVFHINDKHRFWATIHMGSLDATRETYDLHFNGLSLGAAAQSKSFLLELLEEIRIEKTTTSISYTTDKANLVSGNRNDTVTVMHEMQGNMTVSAKADTNGVATRWKAQLTSMRLTVQTIVVDNNVSPPTRTPQTVECDCIGVFFANHNHESASFDYALRTRFHEMHFGELITSASGTGGRDTLSQSIGAKLQGDKTRDSARRQRTLLEYRLEQVLFYEVDKLITVRALRPVAMHAALAVLLMFRHNLMREGIKIDSQRFTHRALCIARIACIQDALEKTFFAPGAPYRGERITLQRLLRLDPVLYTTSEHAVFAIGLLADEVINPWQEMLVGAVLGYMKQELRAGYQPYLRRFSYTSSSDTGAGENNDERGGGGGGRDGGDGGGKKDARVRSDVLIDPTYISIQGDHETVTRELYNHIRRNNPTSGYLPPIQTIATMLHDLISVMHPTVTHRLGIDHTVLEGRDTKYGQPIQVPVPVHNEPPAQMPVLKYVDRNKYICFNYAWLTAASSNRTAFRRAVQACFAYRQQPTRRIVIGDVLESAPNVLCTLEVGPGWRSMYVRDRQQRPRLARVHGVDDSHAGDARLGVHTWRVIDDGDASAAAASSARNDVRVRLPPRVERGLPLMAIPDITYESESERIMLRTADDSAMLQRLRDAAEYERALMVIDTDIDVWAAMRRAQQLFMTPLAVSEHDLRRRVRRNAEARRLPGMRPRRVYRKFGYLAGMPILYDERSRARASEYDADQPSSVNAVLQRDLAALKRESALAMARRLAPRVQLIAAAAGAAEAPAAAAGAAASADVDIELGRFVLRDRVYQVDEKGAIVGVAAERTMPQHELMAMSAGEFKLLAFTTAATTMREHRQYPDAATLMHYPGRLVEKHELAKTKWERAYESASNEERAAAMRSRFPSTFATMESSAAELMPSGERFLTPRVSSMGEAARKLETCAAAVNDAVRALLVRAANAAVLSSSAIGGGVASAAAPIAAPNLKRTQQPASKRQRMEATPPPPPLYSDDEQERGGGGGETEIEF